MTYVVFGATGNIGGATAAALAKAGEAMRLISHREEGLASLREQYPDSAVVQADLFDQASLEKACAGASAVFMNIPDMTPEPDASAVMLAALKASAPQAYLLRLVAWPPGVELSDLTPETQATGIGAGKHLKAKPVIAASGQAHGFLNSPSWFMSNLLWMTMTAVKERNEVVIPSSQRTGFIAPEDIGAAAAAIMTNPDLRVTGREFVVSGPEVLGFDDVAQRFSAVLGRPISHNGDVEVFRGYFGEMTDPIVEYFSNSKTDYEGREVNSELAELIGREPTSLAQWLEARKALFAPAD